MTYRGHVENGVVVLDEPGLLPEGSAVTLILSGPSYAQANNEQAVTDYDRLKPLIGKAKGLPSDLAENHDHYIHGRPKR